MTVEKAAAKAKEAWEELLQPISDSQGLAMPQLKSC
jgi:hypothetical protein